MADEVISGYQYRLRAGSPMPVARGGFVMHTFMAERSVVDNYLCTNNLPGSEEFRGQGGNYISAQFSRLGIVDGNTFQGKIVHNADFVDEDALGFNIG